LLHGFTISGFRNFKGEPQWVAPLSRINIFIGSNNSGKSNVLRFVKRVVEPLISSGPNDKSTTSPVDRPTTGETSSYYEILLPFFDEARADVMAKFRSWQEYFETELKLISIFDDAYIRVPIVWPRATGGPDFPAKEFPPPEGVNEHHWKGMWNSLTGTACKSLSTSCSTTNAVP
jgi:hypothetical protein